MTVEIERKFLVDSVPDVTGWPDGESMRQGYLAQDGEVSVRIRITATSQTLTVKAGTGVRRTEVELPISIEQAEALWAHTGLRRVDKIRYRVPLDNGDVADVDIYGDHLAGLCTAEVEFDSEVAAAAFAAPPWFGADVTDDVRWSNASLAAHGRPDV